MPRMLSTSSHRPSAATTTMSTPAAIANGADDS